MKDHYFYIVILVLLSCNYKDSTRTSLTHNITKDSAKEVKLFNDEESILRMINENRNLSYYGKEVYRFYLVTPLNPIVMFRMVNVNSQFQLTTKVFYTEHSDGQGKDTLISKTDTVLSDGDAMKFTKDLYGSMFWNLKSDTIRHNLDPIFWKIEGFELSTDSLSEFRNEVKLYYRKFGPLNNIYKSLVKLSKVNLEYYE